MRELQPLGGRTYELSECLGRGGFAEVWRATQHTPLMRREVCVKRARSLDPAQRRALLEEARLLSRLSHGNIISLFDAFDDDHGRLHLVLELVEGMDLARAERELTRSGERANAGLVVAVGSGLAAALAALAEAEGGIVHRDISPQNVMLGESGCLKLIDLGVARAHNREAWTATGVIKGKASYLSPEQVRAEPLESSSDVFALGVLLFELAAGCHPFGPSGRDRMQRVARAETPRALARLRPDLPQGLVSLIESMLARAARSRPPVAKLQGLLDASLGGVCRQAEHRAAIASYTGWLRSSPCAAHRAASHDTWGDESTVLRSAAPRERADATVEVVVSGFPSFP